MPLGKSYKLEIFPETKKVSVELSLVEENLPILITSDYKISENSIELKNFSCSKAWLQEAINFYMNTKNSFSISLEKFLAEFLTKFL